MGIRILAKAKLQMMIMMIREVMFARSYS